MRAPAEESLWPALMQQLRRPGCREWRQEETDHPDRRRPAGGGDRGRCRVLPAQEKAPAEDGEDGEDATPAKEEPAKKEHAKKDHPPTFVPLDPFTVNLADKDVDRFAQIGISLEIEDPKIADQLKAYMPAIRGNILMLLSHKVAADLLSREGKLQLAKEINREAVRPLGIELDDEADAGHGEEAPKKKKKKKPAVVSPITGVHFSSFIVQ